MVENVSVRGVRRVVHLGRKVAPNKWLAKVYLNTPAVGSGRTSIAGVFQIYSSGAKRFTPTGQRSDLL